MTRLFAALPVLALAAACSGAADTAPAAETPTEFDLELTEVASGLEFPWGMAVLPSGDMLVTEREGRLRILRGGELDPEPITGVPGDILVERQGGLLDVALDPDFETNRLVYLSYAKGTSDSNATAVTRGRLNEDATALEGAEDILVAHTPQKTGGGHFGSRLDFMQDGTLLVTTGDGFRWMDEAQETDNHFGKILRINPDGTVPDDNPFAAEGGPAAKIWTYGHRNVQGLYVDTVRDKVYAHEHGPKGGDELNIIEPGTNYGWPEITYGVNYDGTIITTETEKEGMAQPAMHWVPSIAPSGMVVYRGEAYPGWQGDIFIAALNGPAGMKLVRVDLDEAGNVVGREDLLTDEDKAYRDVEIGPDGKLYLAGNGLEAGIYRVDLVEPGES